MKEALQLWYECSVSPTRRVRLPIVFVLKREYSKYAVSRNPTDG